MPFLRRLVVILSVAAVPPAVGIGCSSTTSPPDGDDSSTAADAADSSPPSTLSDGAMCAKRGEPCGGNNPQCCTGLCVGPSSADGELFNDGAGFVCKY